MGSRRAAWASDQCSTTSLARGAIQAKPPSVDGVLYPQAADRPPLLEGGTSHDGCVKAGTGVGLADEAGVGAGVAAAAAVKATLPAYCAKRCCPDARPIGAEVPDRPIATHRLLPWVAERLLAGACEGVDRIRSETPSVVLKYAYIGSDGMASGS